LKNSGKMRKHSSSLDYVAKRLCIFGLYGAIYIIYYYYYVVAFG